MITSENAQSLLNVDDYDCGLLNDYGGGNVDWWFDYIRYEIDHCNAYWRSHIEAAISDERDGDTKKLESGKPADPLEILKEIEAYLTFRLLAENPTVPQSDMQQMKKDVAECLRLNGIEVNYEPSRRD